MDSETNAIDFENLPNMKACVAVLSSRLENLTEFAEGCELAAGAIKNFEPAVADLAGGLSSLLSRLVTELRNLRKLSEAMEKLTV